VTAAIGLASGVGNPGAALITTVAVIATLALLRPVRAAVERHAVRHRHTLFLRLRPSYEPSAVVAALRVEPSITVRSMTVGKEDGAAVVSAAVTIPPGYDLTALLARLAGRDDIDSLRDGSRSLRAWR
jgi:uncharacterized membrane protein YhiD involved in acid resistance